MGGKVSKTVSRKALRSLKNVHIEERAQKAIEKHKSNPVAAPRHPTTKDMIEKQVEENPQVKEELKKHDPSLIDRVNRLQLEVTDQALKFASKDRPLPQSKQSVEDPLKAFEDPARIPKGQISYRILLNLLDKKANGPATFKAELIAKEYDLNVQDVSNILQYFEKINLGELVDKTEKQKLMPRKTIHYKVKYDIDEDKPS